MSRAQGAPLAGCPDIVRAVEVTLRPIVASDWRRVHEWGSAPEACRFQVWGPNTEAETEEFVSGCARTWDDPTGQRRVWVAHHADLGVVGIGELKVHDPVHRQGEISYAAHVDFWRRGIGEMIGRGLLEQAFAGRHLHRVLATCDPRNIASGRVVQKIGMTYEGRMRHTLMLRDGWRDSDVYSILETDDAAVAYATGPQASRR